MCMLEREWTCHWRNSPWKEIWTQSTCVWNTPISLSFPELRSSIWWSLGICIVECHQLLSSLGTLLMITLNIGYGYDNDFHKKLSIHRFVTLSFVFVICQWCCKIMMHNPWKYGSWVRWGFGGTQKCNWGMGSVSIVESLRWVESVSLYNNWNLVSSSGNTTFPKILV